MLQAVKIAFTLAAVAAIGLSGAWIIATDGPPEFLVVQNYADSADCVVTFEKGDPWKVSLDRNEARQKFFPFGAPRMTSTVCRAGARTFEGARSTDCYGKPLPEIIVWPNTPDADKFTIMC